MIKHHSINYVEFPARDLAKVKRFYTQVFDWQFEDYGPDYCAFTTSGLTGGFYRAELNCSSQNGGALLVFYSRDLQATQRQVEKAGGRVIKPIFSFPGGCRFHFADPCENELAVWSDLEP